MNDDQVHPSEQRPLLTGIPRAVLAIGLGALLALLAGGVYLVWLAPRDSPASTVADIASAAMRGDADKVAASLDTTSLADWAVSDILATADRPRLVTEYLAAHPVSAEPQLQEKARLTLAQEIREHVLSGTRPKRVPLGNESLKTLVAGVLAKQSVHSVQVDGNVAHIVVEVPYQGMTLSVKVLMRRSGDSWKVERVENLAEVPKKAGY